MRLVGELDGVVLTLNVEEPAHEAIALARRHDGRNEVDGVPVDVGAAVDRGDATPDVVVDGEVAVGRPDGVKRLRVGIAVHARSRVVGVPGCSDAVHGYRAILDDLVALKPRHAEGVAVEVARARSVGGGAPPNNVVALSRDHAVVVGKLDVRAGVLVNLREPDDSLVELGV